MEILDLIKAILLGIIEGITEWLPISSTGHLLLAEELLGIGEGTTAMTDKFMEMFRVVIQLGAILAVVVLYFNKLNPFSPRKTKQQKANTWNLWYKVIVAVLPAAVIGVLLDDWFDMHFYNYVTVSITLIIYGILFIAIELSNKNRRYQIRDLSQMTYKTAIMIGLFQVLALVPGTSRSGATIIGAMLIGTSRYVATEFTFFLAIPVMLGASLLKLAKFTFDSGAQVILLAAGMLVSFVVSILAIKFLLGYIKRNDFKAFGYYRIAIGIVVLAYFLLFN
ncbi:MAG TPA: undecaprenyl-diphosphate phosphatase [Candidatus Atribacteria bacterium]|nr:undecaprenyl-diphosphate phosphatase [Candidatus Atribacteria bacterium]HPT78446.1 undecaprenyl-diphosphate phosphatase [Candidatus Atribacteria bacterium]